MTLCTFLPDPLGYIAHCEACLHPAVGVADRLESLHCSKEVMSSVQLYNFVAALQMACPSNLVIFPMPMLLAWLEIWRSWRGTRAKWPRRSSTFTSMISRGPLLESLAHGDMTRMYVPRLREDLAFISMYYRGHNIAGRESSYCNVAEFFAVMHLRMIPSVGNYGAV